MLRILGVLILSALLAGCAAGLPENYQGPDAGDLVVSISARKPKVESAYSLFIRRKQPEASGLITWLSQSIFSSRTRDFNTATEAGIVEVRTLPAGDYEVFGYDIYENGGMFQIHWNAGDKLSIPFTIRPHETTYIGNFMAVPRHENFLIAVTKFSKGPYFILSDQSARDLPIAAKHTVLPTPVLKQVANPASIDNPNIRASDE